MAIRAVLFDVGGVLLRTEDPRPRRALEERLGLPAGGIEDLVFNSPVSLAATVGRATPQQVWENVRKQLALPPGDLEQVQRDFWAGDRWDETLIRFAKSLRPERRTAVLSNAWGDARERLAPLMASGAFLDFFVSAEEGLMKPDPRFFRLALDRLQSRPRETILIDDQPANLEAACALGIHTVPFTNTEEVTAQVRRVLGS